MSRSGYSEYWDDNWAMICWRGAVAKAIRGKRGQAFLREMLAALDALPEPKLISHELYQDGAVCAMGAVGKVRGTSMESIDPEDRERVAGTFGIATALAAEIAFENDEGGSYFCEETPEARISRMRRWVEAQILPAAPTQSMPGTVEEVS